MSQNGCLQELNMDFKTIKCKKMYQVFGPIFHRQDCQHFDVFLKKNYDLGVRLVDYTDDIYEIIDERKWCLAKLKYGI